MPMPAIVSRWSVNLRRFPWRDACIVFVCAIGLRLAFAALTADTYDPDEFVVLALSRDVSLGAVPYRDFVFFHPPGVLEFFGVLQPVIRLWWPLARAMMLLIDSCTAVMVWRIGTLVYGRRGGIAAGLVYGASPVALLASVRIGQDPIITALGVAGLLILLSSKKGAAATVAGICIGLALWFKYPALLFLPVYLVAAPRRAAPMLAGMLGTIAVEFAPSVHQLGALYADSVNWQLFHRTHTDFVRRVAAVLSFWLVLNPLSLPAALRRRHPAWILTGFAMGGIFFFSSEVYYHYFVPIVPFAALLAGPLLASALNRARLLVVTTGVLTLGLWAGALNVSIVEQGLGILRLSTMNAAVQVLDRTTTRQERVLTDQFEYAYLAQRTPITDYFWDMRDETGARSLEQRLPSTAAVVVTAGADPSYPSGFLRDVQARGYTRIQTRAATVWLAPVARSDVDHAPDIF